MLQRLFALALLVGAILWIVLSYLPDSYLSLPTIAFAGSGRVLAALAVIGLAAFVAIQVVIVYTTLASVRKYRRSRPAEASFRLNLGVEFFWTALPIAMTLAMAWASFVLWDQLTIR